MAHSHFTIIEARPYIGGIAIYFNPNSFNVNFQRAARSRGIGFEDPRPARDRIDLIGRDAVKKGFNGIRIDTTRMAVGAIDVARVRPMPNLTNRQVNQFMESIVDKIEVVLSDYALDASELCPSVY